MAGEKKPGACCAASSAGSCPSWRGRDSSNPTGPSRLRTCRSCRSAKPRSRRPAFHSPPHLIRSCSCFGFLPVALAFPHRRGGSVGPWGDRWSGTVGGMDAAIEPPWMGLRRVPLRRSTQGARTTRTSRSTSKANQPHNKQRTKKSGRQAATNPSPLFTPQIAVTLLTTTLAAVPRGRYSSRLMARGHPEPLLQVPAQPRQRASCPCEGTGPHSRSRLPERSPRSGPRQAIGARR